MAPQTKELQMLLNPAKAGLMSFPGITFESARTASELLKKNELDYHGFFHRYGFHNHMVEDLLACYDFGATPENLHNIYNRVKQVQRPRPEVNSKALVDLSDESEWHKYLGNNDHYVDFLVFFQKEMEEIGLEAMLEKRLFGGTEVADDLFMRCFAGIYHAIIRVGSGLEFGLPALVAEGLSLAASSGEWPTEFLQKAEKEAEAVKGTEGKSLRVLLNEIYNDKRVRESAGAKNPLIYLPFLAAAMDEIVSYTAQYRVPVDQLDKKLAESINVGAFMLGGAMRKDKEVKIDFFLMHGITSSIFLTTIFAQDWIAPENKARFLEWKTRFDLLTYASAGAPKLHMDEIQNYVPKVPHDGVGNPWLSIIERGLKVEDDGHTIKTIKSLINGERACAKYSDSGNDWPVVGDMWWKIGAMSIDSAEGCGDCEGGSRAWVRGAGFDEAWAVFGPRKVNL